MRLLETTPGPRTNARRAAVQAFAHAWGPARDARQAGTRDPEAEAALSIATEQMQSLPMADLCLDVQDLLRTFPEVRAITWTQQRVGTNAQITFENKDELPPVAFSLFAAFPRDALLEIFGSARVSMTVKGIQITSLRS